jgi:hypothetical protein
MNGDQPGGTFRRMRARRRVAGVGIGKTTGGITLGARRASGQTSHSALFGCGLRGGEIVATALNSHV